MSSVALTGGRGFLGWHTRAALQEQGADVAVLPVGEHFDVEQARRALDGAERLIHLAGVNRASEDEVRAGNLLFARQMAEALTTVATPPPVVVYANSTQAGNGSVYGSAKAEAGDILRAAAESVGAQFVDVVLPNLFGEHGRPFYNAVTATFCHLLVAGEAPSVDVDKQLTLLHAQDAADLLIGTVDTVDTAPEQQETVSGLLARLRDIDRVYRAGEIPDLSEKFTRDLFNTYRSYMFLARPEMPLLKHADPRGSFTEIIRTFGGTGQFSFSTTVPGVVRGGHYHRRKVERFLVLSGRARISLRKMFTDEVRHFDVSGDEPVAIDMPTMWTHSIENTGDDILLTNFWTDDHFDPDNPDTIVEAV
ncbi:NAD-dependent epimerase/dehydratase family protein [Corynebacterium nasicanis]|uniref:NAD-dependent epimerase/dehydratase family protein n=1 Tax=Corynebacterium nasicanis TaxID=1448267 RepID=A0ABW1Q8D9_9CORY